MSRKLRFRLAVLAAVLGALVAVGAANADSPPISSAPGSGVSVQKLERIGSAGAFLPGPVLGRLGETVEYQIIVTNNGDEAVTISLADSGCSGLWADGTQLLEPDGGYVAFACSHVLAASDRGSWTNVASVTGTTASGATVSVVPSSVVADVIAGSGVAGAHKTITHKAVKRVKGCKA